MGSTTNTANLNVRIDPVLKRESDKLFKDLGLNMSTAINMFLRQCIREQGLPFVPRAVVSQLKKVKREDTVEKGTLDNEKRERVLPLFLDYTGTTDKLLDGGVENVKAFFDSHQFEHPLDI